MTSILGGNEVKTQMSHVTPTVNRVDEDDQMDEDGVEEDNDISMESPSTSQRKSSSNGNGSS